MDNLRYLARKREKRLDLTDKTEPLLEQPEATLRKGKGYPTAPGASVSPFKKPKPTAKKGRTYLQPGEESPQGSEEQEGPRGGRYYEGEGGAAGEAEQPEPKRRHAYSGAPGREAEDAKQVERNRAEMLANPAEADWDDVAGTYLVGELDPIGGQELIDFLGPPHWTPDEDVGSKTQAMWSFKFRDGTVGTVYDYKTGKSYVGEEGQTLQETTEWHIGGKDKKAAEYVKEMIAMNLREPEEDDVDPKEAAEHRAQLEEEVHYQRKYGRGKEARRRMEAAQEELDQLDTEESEADTGGKREGYGGNRFMP